MAAKAKTEIQATEGITAGEYVRRVGQWYYTTSGVTTIDAENERYSFRGYTPAGEEGDVPYRGSTIEVSVDGPPKVFTEESLHKAANDRNNKARDLLRQVERLQSRALNAPGM